MKLNSKNKKNICYSTHHLNKKILKKKTGSTKYKNIYKHT